MGSFQCGTQWKQLQNNIVVVAIQGKNLIFDIFLVLGHLSSNQNSGIPITYMYSVYLMNISALSH